MQCSHWLLREGFLLARSFATSKTASQIRHCGSHFVLWFGFEDFLFLPRKLGKIPILTNIFQMGGNHQLVFPCFGFLFCFLMPPNVYIGTLLFRFWRQKSSVVFGYKKVQYCYCSCQKELDLSFGAFQWSSVRMSWTGLLSCPHQRWGCWESWVEFVVEIFWIWKIAINGGFWSYTFPTLLVFF